MEWIIGKIIGIFFILFIGYAAAKINWIQPGSLKSLNKILVNIASPSLILYVMTHQVMEEETLALVYWVVGILAAVFIVSALIGRLFNRFFRVEEEDRGINTFSLIYTNNGFLGLPIAQTFLGTASQGFFLMMIGNIFSVFLMFSIGILTITRNSQQKRTLKEKLLPMLNMPILAAFAGIVLMLLHVQLPSAVNDTLSLLGNMMAPLSMLIVGAQLANSHARNVFSEKKYYGMAFLRLIAIPGVLYLLLTWFQVPPLATAILVLTAALPSAAMSVVFAEEHGKNTKLAAEIVFITTIFSIITLPLVLVLMGPLFSG